MSPEFMDQVCSTTYDVQPEILVQPGPEHFGSLYGIFIGQLTLRGQLFKLDPETDQGLVPRHLKMELTSVHVQANHGSCTLWDTALGRAGTG